MHKTKRQFLYILVFAGTVGALWLIVWVCYNLFNFPPVDFSLYSTSAQTRLFPEPHERVSYIACLLILPIFIWALFYFFQLFESRLPDSPTAFRVYGCLISSSWALAFVATLWILWNNPNEFFGTSTYPHHTFFFHPATWLASLGILFILLKKKTVFLRDAGTKSRLQTISIVLSGLIASYTIFDEHSPVLQIKHTDLEAILGPVVNAVHGHTLWIDTRSQYGLYPHFLEPWFRLVGLNILSFTLTIAGLTFLADLFITRVIFRVIRNPWLAFFGFIFYQIISKFPHLGLVIRPLYMPYFPLRILFPALFLFLMHRYLKKPGISRRWGLWLTAVLASLWNMDSGMVVFVATLIVFIYREAVTREQSLPPFKETVIHIAQGLFSLALGFSGYFLFAFIRSGQWPDPAEILYFQNMYYLSGFYMHPMNPWGAWWIPASLYIFALMFCMHYLHKGIRKERNLTLFTLSILGLGLFSYFQGRSYSFGLMFTSYPAVLTFLIFLDDTLPGPGRLIRLKQPGTQVSLNRILPRMLPAGLGILVLVHTTVFTFENIGYSILKNRSHPAELLPLVTHTSLGGQPVRSPYQEIPEIRKILPRDASVFIFSSWSFYLMMALDLKTQIPMDGGNNSTITVEGYRTMLGPMLSGVADYVLFSPKNELNLYPLYSDKDMQAIQSLIEDHYHLIRRSDWVWVYQKT